MIIIKDIPGLTTKELIEELRPLAGDSGITTGYGGIVVDEDTAARFLDLYLVAVGRRAATPEPPTEDTTTPEPEPEPPTRGRRKPAPRTREGR